MRGPFGRGHGPRWRAERFFRRGDMKYVILGLLEDKPKHGYEIIRDLEERFRGIYTPSPGVVYPTLQMLEDMGLVRSREDEGRRVYEMTDAGRAFLHEKEDHLHGIYERVNEWLDSDFWEETGRAASELGDLGELFRRGRWMRMSDPDKRRRVREVLQRAKREILDILDETHTTSPGSEV